MATAVADPLADLRAEVARRDARLYHLAPVVGVHPTRLGQMLRGRIPMPAEVAERLWRALGDVSDDSGRGRIA